jgi:RHS repeat-associated protein
MRMRRSSVSNSSAGWWATSLTVVCAMVGASLAAVPGLSAAATPSSAGAASASASVHHSASGGSASVLARATRRARQVGHRVHVRAMDTATSTTYANRSGTYTTRYSQTPTRVRVHGHWRKINLTLHRTGSRLQAAATPDDVSLSDGGSDPVAQVSTDAGSVALGWSSDLPAPTVDGPDATYKVSGTEDLAVQVTDSGFRADVVLSAAPASAPTYRFPLDLTGYTATTDADGNISFVDQDGKGFQVEPTQMWDAQRDDYGDPSNRADVASKIVQTADGPELDVTPSMSYLTDPSTVYPVVVDPTIDNMWQHGDTYVSNDNPDTNNGSDYKLLVGAPSSNVVALSYVDFQMARFYGQQITNSTLTLYQYGAGSCSAKPTLVDPVQSPGFIPDTTTFNNKPDVNSDGRYEVSQSFNTGGTGCGQQNGDESIDVTKLLAGYVSGSLANWGTELRAPDANKLDAAYGKRFCSMNLAPSGTGHCETADEQPTLSVTYTPQMGLSGRYQMTQHRLNDRSELYVNDRSGDAVIKASDLSIHGVGLDLNVDRFYNSYNTATGSFGVGWDMSVGPDVQLVRRTPDSMWMDYQAPSGAIYGTFVRQGTASNPSDNFDEPTVGGIDADLHYDSDSSDAHYQNYSLTFHGNGEKYWFGGLGCTSCNLVMLADVDRNGNEIDYHYNSSNRHLTSITDTEGRSLTVHYNTAGFIDKLTDNTGRTWQYGYTGNDLTSYIDPTNKETDYSYTNGQVTTITDPAGSDANSDRPTTTLTYTGGQTTAVKYSKDSAVGGVYEFDYTYGDLNGNNTGLVARQGADDNTTHGISSRCTDGADHSTDITDVSDPQGGTTTYCFNDPDYENTGSDRYKITNGDVDVYDGLGKKRSTGVNVDNNATTLTNPTDQGVSGGSTVATYDAGSGGDSNTNSKLESVTDPADPSDTGATTYFDYTSGTSPKDFEPTSEASATGDCTAFGYDANGNLQDSWTGQSADSTHACGTGTGDHNHVDHNANGTVSDSYEPEGDSATADRTNYHYYATGTNTGQLQYMDRPGSDDVCTTNRKLCTSYTYDNLSRIATTTDGKGNIDTYHYDNDDRVTELDLNGDANCDAAHDDCYSYTYDAEGNITSVIDTTNATRTLTYDRLNRQATETVPGSTSTITTAYDGAGNLTSYSYGSDTVTYTYNAANELTGIKDGGHSTAMAVTPTDNGREKSIALYNGVTINYAYHDNGNVKTISTTGGTGLPGDLTYCFTRWCNGGKEYQQLQEQQVGSSNTYYYYDNNDRLCWIGTSQPSSCTDTGGRSYSYNYDRDGNMTKKITPSGTTYYGYNRADELCWAGPNNGTQINTNCPGTPSGDTAYVNNPDGDSNNITGQAITYNTSEQAKTLPNSSGSGTTSMVYQDQGNDLRTSVGSDKVVNGPLGVTGISNGTITINYTRDPYGHLIDERLTTGGVTTTYYYLADRRGSVRALIDSTGHDAGDYNYEPYGALTNASSLTSAAQANPWRWDGGYQDIEGDNYYHFGARYYDPNLGRFTQPDSVIGNIATPHAVNLYTYAGDDPINASDVSGQSFLDDVTNVVDAVGEALSSVSTCFAGAAGAEEAAAPAQPVIVGLPGADIIAETVIPTAGCAIGIASDYYTGVNFLDPSG